MTENPTIKLRLATATSGIGMDCNTVAADIIGGQPGIEILDVKWGRKPTEWRKSGGGWGRPCLTEWQRGYIAACKAINNDEDGAVCELLGIIRTLAS